VTESRLASLDGIGPRVAERRQELGIKVSELASRVSVSPSLISQIERSRSQPSVATLYSLSVALEVPVDYFFGNGGTAGTETGSSTTPPELPPEVEAAGNGGASAEPNAMPFETVAAAREHLRSLPQSPSPPYLCSYSQRAHIDVRGGVRWERLTNVSLGWIDFLELVYSPHAESDSQLYRHPGIEMLVVLEGNFDIEVGFDLYRLSVGDSMMFPSSLPHRYVNPTDKTARAISTHIRDESLVSESRD
jgi:transcriptional regulator with XRE-family HTH domain